jgi:hypothetical protein
MLREGDAFLLRTGERKPVRQGAKKFFLKKISIDRLALIW